MTVLVCGSATQTRHVPAVRYSRTFSCTSLAVSPVETTSTARSGAPGKNRFAVEGVSRSAVTKAISGARTVSGSCARINPHSVPTRPSRFSLINEQPGGEFDHNPTMLPTYGGHFDHFSSDEFEAARPREGPGLLGVHQGLYLRHWPQYSKGGSLQGAATAGIRLLPLTISMVGMEPEIVISYAFLGRAGVSRPGPWRQQ